MVDLLNPVVNAVAISALYALVAVGFTLIFGVGGVLNLAHGALITVGAFAGHFAMTTVGGGVLAGMVAGGVGAAAVAGALYLVLVRRVEDHPVTVMILTLLVALLVEHLIRIFVAGHAITIPIHDALKGQVGLFGGQSVDRIMALVFVVSWLVIGLVGLFVTRTDTGKAVVATSLSDRGARLVGIPTGRIKLYTWVLAGLLAGVAGLLVASYQTGRWDMGLDPLILSFAIVILGGLGSIKGSVVGAHVVGFLEVFTTTYVHPRLSGFSALAVIALVLVLRPQGLFGREVSA